MTLAKPDSERMHLAMFGLFVQSEVGKSGANVRGHVRAILGGTVETKPEGCFGMKLYSIIIII